MSKGGWFKIEIGKLNKRITIQKFSTGIDESGFPLEQWTDYKPVWSSINNLFGREFYSAMAENAENTVKFTIRYRKELDFNINAEGLNTTKVFRIKYKNLFYNITFIDDIKHEHNFMEIKAMVM